MFRVFKKTTLLAGVALVMASAPVWGYCPPGKYICCSLRSREDIKEFTEGEVKYRNAKLDKALQTALGRKKEYTINYTVADKNYFLENWTEKKVLNNGRLCIAFAISRNSIGRDWSKGNAKEICGKLKGHKVASWRCGGASEMKLVWSEL